MIVSLKQVEFPGTSDSSTATVDAKFAVDIFGVRAEGIERDYQFTGYFWSGEFRCQQA